MADDTFDFAKAAQDFMASMKIDPSALGMPLQAPADFQAKLAKIAIEAAQKNAELTSEWTKETFKKVQQTSNFSGEIADITQMATAFSAEQSSDMQEKLTAYAEVAKQAQEETLKLFADFIRDPEDTTE